MQEKSTEEYGLMLAFTHLVIDGVVGLFESIFGGVDKITKKNPELRKAMRDSGVDLADAQKAMDKVKRQRHQSLVGEFAPDSQAAQEAANSDDEAIAASRTESIDGSSDEFQNVGMLRNPHVAGALRNVYADWRFRQYEKKGFLSDCYRQRDERLRQQNGGR